MMHKLLLFLIGTAFSFSLLAQDGYVRGKVIEESSGEPLFGANVIKQGTTIGATTDFDGNFSLKLPIGTHTIVFQSISYQKVVIEGVNVTADEPVFLDVLMKEDVQQLGEVVVTATVSRDNDIGMMTVQKKSINTLDAITSATFRKVGDSDLSSAMKRVTGVTIQGGKYVYVRGLGDRYSATAVNGILIPGLDPDKNSVQMDIFPTGILENVMVYKTFTPDLPGSFTGGLIDIQTKSFPDEQSTSLGVSLGYNPSMHFNNNYLSYDGSPTDWLGFDNGTRKLPVDPKVHIEERDEETTRKFNPTLGGTKDQAFLNTGFSFAHRNQLAGEKLTWGYNVLLTYRNQNSFFDDFERRQYERDATSNNFGLIEDYTALGVQGSNEVLWSGLVSLAAKSKSTTIGTTFLNIQNGISKTVKRTRDNSGLNNPTFIYNDILTYTQRNMLNNITFGKHQIGKIRLNWANSLVFSNQNEPDYRETAINFDDDETFRFSNGGLMNRFWRDLSEYKETFKVDGEFNAGEKNKLKVGGLASYGEREFRVYDFTYNQQTASNVNSEDPNDLEKFLVSESRPDGLSITNLNSLRNRYDGTMRLFAAYIMNEMQISERLKSIYGVRLEDVQMTYTGLVTDSLQKLVDVKGLKTLDETNLLPSVSLIYAINDNMNLRASFTKTLARPSFKEKSNAVIVDPILAIWFNGNIDVKQAEILNYDLRWENFFNRGEKVSISLFYKDFTNHIALVPIQVAPEQIKPRNVGSAEAYGAELELRKNLGFINSYFNNFSTGGNLTYTISRVDRQTVAVGDDGKTEYSEEVAFVRSEKGVDRYRNMSNQAPYSVNAFLAFETPEQDWSANLSYNLQGETLTFVSASNVPEVYTSPFHSMNFKISRKFGVEQSSSLSFRVQNILNDDNEMIYKSGSETELFQVYRPGRTFTLSYNYSF